MSLGFVLAILFSGIHHGRDGAPCDSGAGPDAGLADARDRPDGSIVGAVVGDAISNGNGYVVSFLSFGIAIALVASLPPVRPAAADLGPGALTFPERGLGVEQQRERLQKLGIDPNALRPDPKHLERARLEAMLQELHRAGVLSDEELAEKRARARRT